MKIVVATSSTGGHFFPALSFIESLEQKKSVEVVFILPSANRIASLVKNYPYKFEILAVTSFGRWFSLKTGRAFLQMIGAFFKSLKILGNFQPDFVISAGSYGAIPVCLAARLLKIPIFILEPNYYPGLANRQTAWFSAAFLAGFPQTARFIKCKKFIEVGIPVRAPFYGERDRSVLFEIGLKPGKKVLLIFGGSQGAHSLNEVVLEILHEKDSSPFGDWQIIHATGSAEYENFQKVVAGQKREDYYFNQFLHPLWRYFKAADLTICRAGASTVGEILAARLPAIFVPYPLATDNHQFYNARALVQEGAAFLVADDKLLYNNLKDIMNRINFSANILESVRENLNKISAQPAAPRMVSEILKYIETSEKIVKGC